MQRLQLLQLDLSVLTVAESVLRTSVSAVIFVSTVHQCNVIVENDRLLQGSKQFIDLIVQCSLEFSGTTGSVLASDETESVWLWVMSLCWVKLSPVVGIVKLMTRLVQKHSHCQSLVHACVLYRAPACYCLMMGFAMKTAM